MISTAGIMEPGITPNEPNRLDVFSPASAPSNTRWSKNSRTSIGNGIRQNLSNQLPEFNAWFFGTVQFVFAGKDSEGLQYGTIGPAEKYFRK